MARFSILLLCALLLVRRIAADMELSDLDDDSYTLVQGNARDCPEKIKFNTENAVIESNDIRVNQKTDCDDGVSIALSRMDGNVRPGASAPVRYFAASISDVEPFYQGRNDGPLVCGSITFPQNTQWIFINPDEELDDVKWTDVYGDTPRFAIDDDSEVDFDDNERYLLVGDLCFFRDTSITDRVCFPGDAKVQLEDGSVKTMDKLTIGDRVHVGEGVYSDIFAWTHQDARKKFKFVQLTTEDGNKLTATGSHYVYAEGQSMMMKHVCVGMSLRLADGSASRVVSKEKVLKPGLYNPQTMHGDIVVDGFIATTYTAAVQPEAAHALLAPVRAAFQAARSLLSVEQSA